MKEVKVIKLIHDIIHRADYVFLSEFFRFIGVYVCERVMGDEEAFEKDETVADACFYIGERTTDDWSEEQYRDYEGSLPKDKIVLYDFLREKSKKKEWNSCVPIMCSEEELQRDVLRCVLNKVWEIDIDKVDEHNCKTMWDELIDTYVNCDLSYHSINLQYYPKKREPIFNTVRKSFLKASQRIQEIEDYKDSFYSYYALLWCKTKVNLACDYLGEASYFFVKELPKECQALCDKYSGYSNAKVLLGLCYEPFKGYGSEALLALSSALAEIKENCYAASVYYWVGKWYEHYKKKDEAEKGYRLANKRRKNYRNCFKLGILAKDKPECKEALDKFDEVLDGLKKKQEFTFLDPLEVEYIFKTYAQKCSIAYENEKFQDVISFGESALALYESIPKQLYYSLLYGDDVDEYREMTRQRLNRNNIYWFLSGAYRGLENEEKANEYQKMILR